MKKVLIIAGFDPSGGAGVLLDVKVVRALNSYATSVVTSLTVQDTQRVYDLKPIDPHFFEYQLQKVVEDIKPDSVKIGLLGSSEIAVVVLRNLKRYNLKKVVCDPVLKSTSGFEFCKSEFIEFLKYEFFKACDVITPNKNEAEVIFDVEIKNFDEDVLSCVQERMKKMGIKSCILKGGHLPGEVAEDVLITHNDIFKVHAKKQGFTDSIHGTGCAFSTAFATFLAKGYNMYDALISTKEYVSNLIYKSTKIGNGKLILNP
ncbi:bifunctional hydroxymethylpyrimidine kinase/phosphomethylpyrimidine kinase [Anaerocellum diazotrophicum]|uniref:Hydroxymethylpyrimidine/phosphomethylpyrimidine kinase n=1 Tax=Caldicellulosiruptor diazotrophicus TaxID=2806205 RepID=A0ABN6E9E2_9FIRM|nr:bifunctional hydroxymethylpyrimidine kinase/phosphomethylpyrimidine kinase [Caldicellulosiruptor diazotrophicus]BCS82107.1 hydroxymethylpyrimidine/phosphomethylpyrimidine kinase [Caldicellulosiruptor diazotrophicus]